METASYALLVSVIANPIELAERIVRASWRWHFHITRWAYGLAITVGGLVLAFIPFPDGIWIGALLLVIGLLGLARWLYYSRPAAFLVVPLFAGQATVRGEPEEVRRIIVTTLQDKLGPFLYPAAVRAIPAVVGPDAARFAHRLLVRLRALYLVYGEIRQTKTGGYQVFGRLAVRAGQIEHRDWHTRDKTPQRTIWHILHQKLTPEADVQDVEYPFEFANELQAILRSVEGLIFEQLGQSDQAEESLREALAVAPDSESSAIDGIRMSLARVIFAQGRHDEAIDLLRRRPNQVTASADLLVLLAHLLSSLYDPSNPWGRTADPSVDAEILELLRRAAKDVANHRWDLFRYNLAVKLLLRDEHRGEGLAIIEELLHSRSHYRRAWYIRRLVAVAYWNRAQDSMREGREDEARRVAKQAAKWYSRSIRARPKFRIVRRRRLRVELRRYQRSAILHANARDAHQLAANRIRARYHHWRFRRRQNQLIELGNQGLSEQDWGKAYANFDWAIVGYKDDSEVMALVGKAIAIQQLGNLQLAAELWHQANENDPQLAHAAEGAFARKSHFPAGLPH
jgi:Tfp pilus assembly protein PilF